jgi:hypothetical protein
MFIVLRKKIVKRYLILAIGLMLIGNSLVSAPSAQASDSGVTMTVEELRSEGFNDEELKQAGFITGIGKIIIYNQKQKQIWDMRVQKAQERVRTARYQGRKPNPKDLALLDIDKQRKDPPKKSFKEKWFGQTTAQFIDYYKKDKNPPDAKIIFGDGLTITGLFLLLKALAPLAI